MGGNTTYSIDLLSYANGSHEGFVEFCVCRGELIHEHLWGWRTGPLSVRRGVEIARRADRGEAHEQFTQLRSSPER